MTNTPLYLGLIEAGKAKKVLAGMLFVTGRGEWTSAAIADRVVDGIGLLRSGAIVVDEGVLRVVVAYLHGTAGLTGIAVLERIRKTLGIRDGTPMSKWLLAHLDEIEAGEDLKREQQPNKALHGNIPASIGNGQQRPPMAAGVVAYYAAVSAAKGTPASRDLRDLPNEEDYAAAGIPSDSRSAVAEFATGWSVGRTQHLKAILREHRARAVAQRKADLSASVDLARLAMKAGADDVAVGLALNKTRRIAGAPSPIDN